MKPPCKAHHYLLPAPDGSGELLAVCKLCGATRVYQAYVESDWVGHRKAHVTKAQQVAARDYYQSQKAVLF